MMPAVPVDLHLNLGHQLRSVSGPAVVPSPPDLIAGVLLPVLALQIFPGTRPQFSWEMQCKQSQYSIVEFSPN